ncbi:ATP-binding cassette domain-containing protein [Streptosporangium lutulentum]
MSATIVAKDLAAGHGDRALFSGLNLVVAPGDVIGLVGVNGAGKSTLMRILAELTPPEHGTVRLSPPSAAVGYLPQERSAERARRSRSSWRGGPGWPPRNARSTPRPRGWSRDGPAPTTTTPPAWSGGWPWGARTWKTGPRGSSRSSA